VFRANGSLTPSGADQPTDITVYQFELNQPTMYLLSQSFQMRDGDVLFVTQEPISRWNDTVAKLLSPVVTTIRAQTVVTALSDG
jgi:polysaccharide export outer membrane protein